jgi:hypothetical protein
VNLNSVGQQLFPTLHVFKVPGIILICAGNDFINYRTIIWPVVSMVADTEEESRLKVLVSRVLRRIFGPKRDEVTGERRKLHDEELNDMYCSPTTVRVIKSRRTLWARYVARMGEGRGVYRVLVGELEGKIPLERPRRTWEDNIQADLQEVGCRGMDWNELA